MTAPTPGAIVAGATHRNAARDWHVSGLVASLAAALLIGAVGAFWPRYLAERFASIDRYTHAHAAIGVSWLLLLLLQTTAIHTGRRPLHRIFGRLGVLLALAFVASGVLLAHYRFARMNAATFEKEAFFLYLPMHIAALFALTATLGFVYRRNTALHARFMATTALLLIDPVVVRLLAFNLPELPGATSYQLITFALTDAAFVVLALNFRPAVQGRAPLWNFLAVMLVAQALWFTFAQSETWYRLATWFRALPLT